MESEINLLFKLTSSVDVDYNYLFLACPICLIHIKFKIKVIIFSELNSREWNCREYIQNCEGEDIK